MQDPRVTRPALDAQTLRLDGARGAANNIVRKRAVFHNALGYAVELGLPPVNPLDKVKWKAPKADGAVNLWVSRISSVALNSRVAFSAGRP